MLFTTASNSSPIIYYFTLALLIITPLIMFGIGIHSVRSDDSDKQRAGYAMLKLAGFVTALILIGFVYMWRIGVFSGPGFEDPNVKTTTAAAATEAAKGLIALWR